MDKSTRSVRSWIHPSQFTSGSKLVFVILKWIYSAEFHPGVNIKHYVQKTSESSRTWEKQDQTEEEQMMKQSYLVAWAESGVEQQL